VLQDRSLTEDNVHMRSPSRLKGVLIASDDKTIVMLATSEKGDLEIWGAFIGALEMPRKMNTASEDNIYFHPSTDSACLVEDRDSIKLLVTTSRAKSTYRFHLGRLFARRLDY
jgi:hypothetical protein